MGRWWVTCSYSTLALIPCIIGRYEKNVIRTLVIAFWDFWRRRIQKLWNFTLLSYFGDLEGETLECAMKGIILETRCGICQLPWWSLYASTTENLWRFLLPFQRQIGLLSQSSDSSRRGFSQCGCPSHEGRVKIVLLLPPFFLFEMKRNLYWIG